ncbi:MAG: PD-(D/E)XK nuclease family protein, partial [Gemmatales bacterium]|nr:PD-(D/E)XK nuclease family protein [Gemmatales bacterium]
DIGELLHRILQFFVLRYVREFIRPDPESPGDASSQGELESITQREHRLREMVNEVAEAVIGELEDDRFEASARRRYVLRQAQRILGDYVLALDRQLRRGHFVPCTTELGFGQNDTRAVQWAVEFLDPADGQSIVRLFPRGRIDRIDVVPGAEDNSALENRNGSDLPDTTVQVTPLCDSARAVLPRSILWLRVVDYKLSPMSLELDRIYYGLDLQLMLYLLVAHEIFQLPIGQCCTFYAPLRRIPKSLDVGSDPGENPELDWLPAQAQRRVSRGGGKSPG